LASQMAPAVFDTVAADIVAVKTEAQPAKEDSYVFRATGSTMRFAGFMTIYSEQADDASESDDEKERSLPDLEEDDTLVGRGLEPRQHVTQPPPRFSEAMLVKTLEELGIGRPSTYASIIDTLQRR